jgi:3alpha(or 20beta)-hydroxysteroid dehydrogenase
MHEEDDMGELEGRVALVTGGARGLGAAIVQVMAREGATVVASDLRVAEGKELADRLASVEFAEHDVTDEASWRSVVDGILRKHGRLDVLVNNAGIVDIAPVAGMNLQQYLRVIAVNQTGVYLGLHVSSSAFLAQGNGVIINIASVDGLRGSPGTAAYSASKHAVLGLTKSLALELGGAGIRVVAVCPGPIATPMASEADFSALGDVDLSTMLDGVPIRRIAEPSEIAEVVSFLASDRASYCTGSEFVIDGGWTAGLPT